MPLRRRLVDGEGNAADGEETVVGDVGAAHGGLLAAVLSGTSLNGDLVKRKEVNMQRTSRRRES